MRNKDTPSAIFRAAASELGRILVYEAARDWLPTIDGQVQTPLGIADATFVDPSQPIKVRCTVLRRAVCGQAGGERRADRGL